MKEYRIEVLDVANKNEELKKYTAQGWIPKSISANESLSSYVGNIVVLFEREKTRRLQE